MTPTTGRLIAVLLALAMVAAACGDDDGDGEAITRIAISGSSTVEPISARVAQAFHDIPANSSVAIAVDGPGTSDGFVLFCNGETDISDASRAIKQAELDTCLANGVEPIEIKVAIDGLSVITSVNNDMVSCLDFGDLYALLGSESVGFDTWSDADTLAAELAADGLGASHAPYPNVTLVITAPGEESGTFDSFIEIVLAGIAGERGTEPEPRLDYQASPNDDVIIDGVARNGTSLGWVGYAFYINNTGAVKALEVDGGEGCVAPTPETIASFDYPIARPLYIYVNKARLDAKPRLVDFVDFYLGGAGLVAVDGAGYVRLTAEEQASWKANWESRTVGKVDG
ncbi:MAG: substrate-binding domain-containing protein [Actinomycetota bacterium]|nr:substrate-binding domain-containing protein [Actinomycetota bacterium]